MFCSESFSGLCFACLGLESCWRSGVSELCLQGTFANGFAWLVLFFMDSKGNVRRVFLACVFHARGTHPDAVRVFRKQFPKAMWRDHWRGISRAIELLFFMDSKGNVRRGHACLCLLERHFCLLERHLAGDRIVVFYGFQR